MPHSARKTCLETRTGRLANKIRRAPYFVKITEGLHLGCYRGSAAGCWIARRYRGGGNYETDALGIAADGIKVLDFWQAQGAAKSWAERRRLIEAGVLHSGLYSVGDAVADYLEESRTEKRPDAVRGTATIVWSSDASSITSMSAAKMSLTG